MKMIQHSYVNEVGGHGVDTVSPLIRNCTFYANGGNGCLVPSSPSLLEMRNCIPFQVNWSNWADWLWMEGF